jgi:hypothetical protein
MATRTFVMGSSPDDGRLIVGGCYRDFAAPRKGDSEVRNSTLCGIVLWKKCSQCGGHDLLGLGAADLALVSPATQPDPQAVTQ